MVYTLNKCRFILVLVAVRFQKLHKLGQAGFLGFAEIVLDMASEIGLAEGGIVVRVGGNDLRELFQTGGLSCT